MRTIIIIFFGLLFGFLLGIVIGGFRLWEPYHVLGVITSPHYLALFFAIILPVLDVKFFPKDKEK
ncbi:MULTISPECIES: hypothetical protein [Bacillaceae]|uniref:Uncharacterized protein n=1 Tax=Evansella alkalicola TaxID=745819 RepID=A0ABS6K0J0_9BACI|nr:MULTISPECIES: hypothetical protein [Bacillaceae]MBU9723449.1 hypothetical protein [Bacillus alkalicola]